MITFNYIISPTAQENLTAIAEYLSNTLHNPTAAKDFLIEFERTIDVVCTAPKGCARCRKSSLRNRGIRFVTVKNYKVYFVINDELKRIEILFVRHKLQNT